MRDFNALAYIHEQTSFEDDNRNLGYKVYDKGNRFYVTFDAILQSFGDINRNRRMYLAENIMDQINHSDYITTQLKNNSWGGELDHPASPINGEELSMNRIANVDMKQTSHFIRNPKLIGNLLEAHIQTDSSNDNGMCAAIRVVDGKCIPCFSARVLGELTNQGGKPIVNVKKLITYDMVNFPSHFSSRGKINQLPLVESVDQIITESVNEIEKYSNEKIVFLKDLAQAAANNSQEVELICEAFDLTIDDIKGLTTNGSIVIQENKNLYIQPLTQKRIKQKTINSMREFMLDDRFK